ncbi:hypothetical protein E2542_SST03519 [Spatholobus suberectus]|nr:hypothetical protein E2542_SST03519 [Spatholobus suberectus]
MAAVLILLLGGSVPCSVVGTVPLPVTPLTLRYVRPVALRAVSGWSCSCALEFGMLNS